MARRHPAGGDFLDVLRHRDRGDRRQGQPVLDVLESTAQAMFKFTGYVMAFAPVGVFAAFAATVGSKGLGILLTLGKLVG
jgi:Na+/H+-dicarboxylate symporters